MRTKRIFGTAHGFLSRALSTMVTATLLAWSRRVTRMASAKNRAVLDGHRHHGFDVPGIGLQARAVAEVDYRKMIRQIDGKARLCILWKGHVRSPPA
jgi:hypothetical protein